MNAELNLFFEDLDKQAGNVDANSEQKNNGTSGATKKAGLNRMYALCSQK